MSNVILSEFVTLDGIMEAPHKWQFPFWNDETGRFKLDELLANDALLLGRVTYQEFAEAWPSMTDNEGFAERMNSLPKYVVSTTLNAPDISWNNSRLIRGDVAGAISKLKQQPDNNLLISGGAGLVHSLMQWDLIDEYRLLVYPVVLGRGKRLFRDDITATLKLVETKTLGSDVVLLTYRPDRREQLPLAEG
jgi:dihydrofolate reductase